MLANQCWNIYVGILGVLIILHSGYLQHTNQIIYGSQRAIDAGLVHFFLPELPDWSADGGDRVSVEL